MEPEFSWCGRTIPVRKGMLVDAFEKSLDTIVGPGHEVTAGEGYTNSHIAELVHDQTANRCYIKRDEAETGYIFGLHAGHYATVVFVSDKLKDMFYSGTIESALFLKDLHTR
jgi:hypothetical protein